MNNEANHSSRAVRDQIVGKCISGVIARPGRTGEPPMVMMLQFDDGSVLEFVSPRSDRILKDAIEQTRRRVRWPAAGGLPRSARTGRDVARSGLCAGFRDVLRFVHKCCGKLCVQPGDRCVVVLRHRNEQILTKVIKYNKNNGWNIDSGKYLNAKA